MSKTRAFVGCARLIDKIIKQKSSFSSSFVVAVSHRDQMNGKHLTLHWKPPVNFQKQWLHCPETFLSRGKKFKKRKGE